MRLVAMGIDVIATFLNAALISLEARAQSARERDIVRVPIVRAAPYWDSNIVPRYPSRAYSWARLAMQGPKAKALALRKW